MGVYIYYIEILLTDLIRILFQFIKKKQKKG